ncbi:MAG: hypothetical protein JNK64_33140 [Myxococcales bacterium]|nr:hypothetical protein [Myxococcales bacterium]
MGLLTPFDPAARVELADVAAQLAGCTLECDDDRIPRLRLELDDGGAVHVTTRREPDGVCLVTSTIDLQGAMLRVLPRQREVDGTPAKVAAALDEGDVQIACDDPALAEAWIDAPTRDALPACLWVTAGPLRRTLIDGARIGVGDGEVLMAPVASNPAHLAAVIEIGVLLASRPARLGAELAAVAAALGGAVTAAAFDLGERFAMRFERDAASVTADFIRRMPDEPAKHARLRTRIRAPTSIDAATLARRLAAAAAAVRDLGAPPIALAGGDVALVLDGLVGSRERLAPAIGLVARLAEPAAVRADGPYR